MPPVPRVAHAVVGGSGTSAIEFPHDLDDARVEIIADGLQVDTPFGPSPALAHVSVATASPRTPRREALVVGMHGWSLGDDRRRGALALFWALREAGVQRVVGETGAGSITQNFRPRDLVLCHDVIDLTPQVGGRIDTGTRVIMRRPFCPEIRAVLWTGAQALAADRSTRAFDRAVAAATEGTRFETGAEVTAYARLGGDLVAAGVSPEVYLAREIGACYGSIATVLNYAEGVRPHWDYELLEEIVRDDARSLGSLLVSALAALPERRGCECASFRKPVGAATQAASLTDTA